MNETRCEYCQISNGQKIGTEEVSVFLCEKCESLLKEPQYGIRLLRGHLSMKLRGTDSEEGLKNLIEGGIQELRKLEIV